MGKTISLYGFSSVEHAEEVKRFLEQYTGEGSVCAVEIGQYKNDLRKHAKVQFTDSESAETIKSLANKRIWYGDCYLRARDLCTEMVPEPKAYLCSMDNVTLHFGCQVSKQKFSVLWRGESVCVKFGEELRKLYFFLSYDSVDYKLELSYESIRQIELHQLHSETSKFLVLQ
ncbi:RNA-dependent RNA polymerase 1-like, partial [Morus notabilis]|uniref:RNA-dependent RNA polymerase 1-like n=1 Tax=Morus notabilis TaxID=981085 RepID=UPI000CED33D7